MPIAQDRLEVLQVCKLLQYVRDEDKVGIEKMIINGMPHIVNYNEPLEGNTALMTAACANNDKMLEYLLYLGAHPDVMDFKGRSAVMRAAEYGHVQCMDLLAAAGADMRQTDLEGKSKICHEQDRLKGPLLVSLLPSFTTHFLPSFTTHYLPGFTTKIIEIHILIRRSH